MTAIEKIFEAIDNEEKEINPLETEESDNAFFSFCDKYFDFEVSKRNNAESDLIKIIQIERKKAFEIGFNLARLLTTKH